MSSKKKNIYIFLGKVILITLLIVFCIRTFFIEPYTVSTAQMETALVNGEKILIDKTAYGIRMPITILTVPFTFDKYSDIIELPYKRIFESSVKRNDIVLFNNPSDSLKPLDKGELLLSRCVALPGDSVQVEKTLPDSVQATAIANTTSNYKFMVPAKGKTIKLNTEAITIYKQIILLEKGSKAKVVDNKLYILGEEQKYYTFTDNYYWLLSDNTLKSSDSRSLGFIPFKNIIGKARFIWYSSAKGRSFSTIE